MSYSRDPEKSPQATHHCLLCLHPKGLLHQVRTCDKKSHTMKFFLLSDSAPQQLKLMLYFINLGQQGTRAQEGSHSEEEHSEGSSPRRSVGIPHSEFNCWLDLHPSMEPVWLAWRHERKGGLWSRSQQDQNSSLACSKSRGDFHTPNPEKRRDKQHLPT